MLLDVQILKQHVKCIQCLYRLSMYTYALGWYNNQPQVYIPYLLGTYGLTVL